ncbi:hypothetical protein HII36_36860 [Nonomuraea sp. NN258]|uniref:hypothetical protein n=1 Tax=Nonomuraea antri TaxID=2730852 RepID=UPI001569BD41|nr:hypothetical protein [Nonomuraea antri]NRQ37368.1 hypothetical protein [Nonomuraea antri]
MTEIEIVEATVNGLPVAVAQVPWARVAAGVLEVGAGHACDPVGGEGLAHVTEHVRAAVAGAVAGIRVTGVTEPSVTRYTASAPAPDALALARTLVTVLAPLPHDARTHAAEVNAVLVEMARTGAQPRLRIAPAAVVRALPGAEQAMLDRADESSVRGITAEQVRDFTAAQHPSSSLLCLVSAHAPESVLREVSERQADSAGSEHAPAFPRVPDAARNAAAPMSPEPALVLVAESVRGGDLAVARDLAFEVLFRSGGLLDSLAADAGLAGIGFSRLPGRRSDVGVLAWRPAHAEQADEFVGSLTKALDGAAVSEADIERARARRRGALAFEQQSAPGLARQLAAYLAGRAAWPDAECYVRAGLRPIRDCVAEVLATASLWLLTEESAEKVWASS